MIGHPAISRPSHAFLVIRIFLPLAFGYMLSYLLRTLNATLAPDLIRDFDLSASELGLLTSVYFLAFGVMQIPLGMAIDRFGARRVQACNLLVSAVGAVMFATAMSTEMLMVGRALVGAGVAVSLMAGFATMALWLPAQQLPMAYGLLMAFGGVGAVLAGSPAEWASARIGWRALFFGLSLCFLAGAAAIFVLMPNRHPNQGSPESPSELLRGLKEIYRSSSFWRVVPMVVLTCGTGFAMQSLWTARWLAEVAGLERQAVALHMSVMALGLLAGSIACGPMAAAGRRLGLSLARLVGLLAFVYLAVLTVLAAGYTAMAMPLWTMIGFLMNPLSLSYAVLTTNFSSHLAGRVQTGINVLVILGSFVIQTAFGWLIDFWMADDNGFQVARGYGITFGFLIIPGLVATIWYWIGVDALEPELK
ncbi:MFS transporter [Geminicoccus harenae]|uniref:MFS transporter n=1 Tax=Geminicoccus harenae TaxID=2498453 RepID=UPI00168B110D|nr:MFS transporter [Geminicoccus harenae]